MITLGGVSIAVIIAALVAVAKKLEVPSRYLPLVSLSFGLLIGFGSYLTGQGDLVDALVAGGLTALAASGTYDVVKKSILGK